jgi:ubiquinone/menaquinone biosynthesis C-methylase UbiE
MSNSDRWRRVWEDKSKENVPDFQLDRGITPREQEIENLSEQELLNFIEPQGCETLLDAGCGTGVNILRLHSRVRNIVAIDYARGSLERCQKRIQEHHIENAILCLASVKNIPLPDCSVEKIICLSVLQYLDDEEVRQAFKEFARVLVPGGKVILHVKNLSSLYWMTLWMVKKLKLFLGRSTRLEYVRTYQWYVNEIKSLNCEILDYNSFNLLILDRMPKSVLSFLQRFELEHCDDRFFRSPFIRRHGSELKIKARRTAPHPKASTSDRTSDSAKA